MYICRYMHTNMYGHKMSNSFSRNNRECRFYINNYTSILITKINFLSIIIALYIANILLSFLNSF